MATVARRRGEGVTTAPRRRREGVAATARRAVRGGLWGVARVVRLVTAVVVGIVLLGILLVLLEANRGNDIVNAVLNAGEFLVKPFDNVFKPDGHKAMVGVNWGLAAAIYAFAGGLVVRLLRR